MGTKKAFLGYDLSPFYLLMVLLFSLQFQQGFQMWTFSRPAFIKISVFLGNFIDKVLLISENWTSSLDMKSLF